MIAIVLRWLAPYLMRGVAIAALMLAAWLYIGHVERSARASQKAADAAVVREATLQADLAAERSARRAEAHSAENTRQANDDLITAMSDSRRKLDAYLVRLKAAQGRAVATGLPTTADAADIIDRADRDALLALDLRICTDNTTRLANAREWAMKEFPQ